MKNKSRKAKGRYLQNLVKEEIMKLYPALTNDDIRTSLMSENGADVKLLSQMSRKLFPYSIECNNREDLNTLYKHYKQAMRHAPYEPLLVVKKNREKALAVISLEHFFELQKE